MAQALQDWPFWSQPWFKWRKAEEANFRESCPASETHLWQKMPRWTWEAFPSTSSQRILIFYKVSHWKGTVQTDHIITEFRPEIGPSKVDGPLPLRPSFSPQFLQLSKAQEPFERSPLWNSGKTHQGNFGRAGGLDNGGFQGFFGTCWKRPQRCIKNSGNWLKMGFCP